MDVHEIISTSLEVFKQPVVIAAAIGVFLYVKFMIFVETYAQKPVTSTKRRVSVPKKKPPKEEESSESSEDDDGGSAEE